MFNTQLDAQGLKCKECKFRCHTQCEAQVNLNSLHCQCKSRFNANIIAILNIDVIANIIIIIMRNILRVSTTIAIVFTVNIEQPHRSCFSRFPPPAGCRPSC